MAASQRQAAQFQGLIVRSIERATMQEAHELRKEIVLGLRSQSPGGRAIKPLKETTILLRGLPKSGGGGRGATRRKSPRRGPTKALIHHGDLIGGINVKRVGFAHYTVGIHRGERGKNGQDLVNIAEIHENGTRQYTVTVTPRMHKFSLFLYQMGVLKAPWPVGKKFRKKIPARPFLGPSHESWEMNASERFSTRLDIFLMGKSA